MCSIDSNCVYNNPYKNNVDMKVNEAPKRLYLNWVNYPLEEMQVEYTRTDAFIEKALKFIKTNVDRIVNNQHGVCMGCMDVDFRKYMEGE